MTDTQYNIICNHAPHHFNFKIGNSASYEIKWVPFTISDFWPNSSFIMGLSFRGDSNYFIYDFLKEDTEFSKLK